MGEVWEKGQPRRDKARVTLLWFVGRSREKVALAPFHHGGMCVAPSVFVAFLYRVCKQTHTHTSKWTVTDSSPSMVATSPKLTGNVGLEGSNCARCDAPLDTHKQTSTYTQYHSHGPSFLAFSSLSKKPRKKTKETYKWVSWLSFA